MARKTCIVVYGEVLISFEVAMAGAAGYFYALYILINMVFMSEFDAAVVSIRGNKLFSAVTFGPHTGCIRDCGIWLCTNSADYTINCLGHPVNLAFYVTGEAGL
jgi:hypothetical protein